MKDFLTALLALLLSILTMILASLIVALPIMSLWNWLVPMIFGLTTINFIQSAGLFLLVSLIFKSGLYPNQNK